MEKDGAQQKGYLASKHAENIVLVGQTGKGKSATANSLIGKMVFGSKTDAYCVTKECQTHEAVTVDGHTINVIDTPGLSAEYISKEIVKCLTLAEGGIHVVLLIVSARTRVTQKEENTLSTLKALFGSEILSHVIVVFTGGDVLEEKNETLEDYLDRDCPDLIKEIIKMSGNRMVLIDNKTTDEGKKAEQVHKLLSRVDEVRKSNHGEAYTNEMYHEIKEETDKLRKQNEELESKNHSDETVSLMKDQLHASYEKNLSRVSKTVEKKLKDALEAQEHALSNKLGKARTDQLIICNIL